MMKVKVFFIAICFNLLLIDALSQEQAVRPRLTNDFDLEFVYESSWSGNFKLRTDGWQFGGEYSKYKTYAKTTIYQVEFGLLKHAKQVRQNKDPNAGWFNSNGIKPFVYGKRYNLFSLQAAVGQKFLLAEKSKRNGVMIHYYYAGGMTLGILKPYYLRVCGDDLCNTSEEVTYEEGIDNKFSSYEYIIGAAGFGVGWKLKFRPGLHLKTGLQFDWSSQDNMIKAIDVGVSVNSYLSKVPIMISEENKFMFINAYVGFTLGKKK